MSSCLAGRCIGVFFTSVNSDFNGLRARVSRSCVQDDKGFTGQVMIYMPFARFAQYLMKCYLLSSSHLPHRT